MWETKPHYHKTHVSFKYSFNVSDEVVIYLLCFWLLQQITYNGVLYCCNQCLNPERHQSAVDHILIILINE